MPLSAKALGKRKAPPDPPGLPDLPGLPDPPSLSPLPEISRDAAIAALLQVEADAEATELRRLLDVDRDDADHHEAYHDLFGDEDGDDKFELPRADITEESLDCMHECESS